MVLLSNVRNLPKLSFPKIWRHQGATSQCDAQMVNDLELGGSADERWVSLWFLQILKRFPWVHGGALTHSMSCHSDNNKGTDHFLQNKSVFYRKILTILYQLPLTHWLAATLFCRWRETMDIRTVHNQHTINRHPLYLRTAADVSLVQLPIMT